MGDLSVFSHQDLEILKSLSENANVQEVKRWKKRKSEVVVPKSLEFLEKLLKNPSGDVKAVAVLLIGLLGMVYQASQLPPPQNGAALEDYRSPPPRIKLRDGRYLAYKEKGVDRNKADFKIIVCHGFGSSKDMNLLAPQELIDELGICFILFDRPGYGESDPNPKRSLKSEALDIQELADHLQLGSKFYVLGISIGSFPTWSCLKYIPDRLAGVALVVPVVNYGWPSLPNSLIKNDYRRNVVRFGLWLSKHTPGLLHWWVTQKWFPSTSVLERNPVLFNDGDINILKSIPGFPMLSPENLQDRGVFNTLRRDFMMAFDDWEFDPIDMSNPFPESKSRVHIWHGYEDKVVPIELQRYITGKLPWIRYHEVDNGGHLIVHYGGVCEAILRALLLGQESDSFRPKPLTETIVD